MLAAGGGYKEDNTSTEGDVSMMMLCDNGTFQPFWRARSWALEQAISIDCIVGDLRWAMLALVLSSLGSVWALARDQFVLVPRRKPGGAPC